MEEPPNFSIHNWVSFHSYPIQNPQSQSQIHNEEEEEEALSLCDMAAAGKPPTNLPGKQFSDQHQDFYFNLPEKQMCSADEVFFRGQILPFRHSVSLPSGFMTRPEIRNSISVARSEPVSRSSSTGSHNSGTSGSGSEFTGYKPVTRNLNRFHSYPSPTPQIRTRNYRRPDPKPSLKWGLLQLGVLKPQEIGLADLKNRSERSMMMKEGKQKKTTTNHVLLFGGCKCSAIEVESGVSWRIPMVKQTALKQESNVGRRKHAAASHRTSEWLKQL